MHTWPSSKNSGVNRLALLLGILAFIAWEVFVFAAANESYWLPKYDHPNAPSILGLLLAHLLGGIVGFGIPWCLTQAIAWVVDGFKRR